MCQRERQARPERRCGIFLAGRPKLEGHEATDEVEGDHPDRSPARCSCSRTGGGEDGGRRRSSGREHSSRLASPEGADNSGPEVGSHSPAHA